MLKRNDHFEKFQGRFGQCPKHLCFLIYRGEFKVANEFSLLGDRGKSCNSEEKYTEPIGTIF